MSSVLMASPKRQTRTLPDAAPDAAPIASVDGGAAASPSEADAQLVERALDEFLTTCAAELRELDPRADEVVDAIRTLVRAGGKRLRPRFVTTGYRAAGHEGWEKI